MNETLNDRDNEEKNNTGNEPPDDEDENSIDDVSNKSATKSDGAGDLDVNSDSQA